MSSTAWEILTYCALGLGTGAVGITAVCTSSWLPMAVGYPLVVVATLLAARHTSRTISAGR